MNGFASQLDPAAAGTVTPTAAESAAGEAAVDDAQLQKDATQATEGDAAQSARDKDFKKLQRRIDNRTRALGERDQQIADLRRQLAERQSTADTDDDDGAPTRPQRGEDVETRAREIASETRYRERISEKTVAMLKAGEALDGFKDLARDVAEEIPFLDRSGRPTPFIEAVLDSDAPAQLLYHLGQNPDLVADLADLSPTQLARKLARLEIEIAKQPPKRSAAPKPLAPVNGGGLNAKDETAMSDAEWRASRLKKRA